MATKKQVFIPTRSKSKALAEAKKRGIENPIATKAQGGFVVYSAYQSNPKGRRMATAKQIAWRKKFAAMAKAGTLRKGKKKLRRVRRASPEKWARAKAMAKKADAREKAAIAGKKIKVVPRFVRRKNPLHSGFAVNIGVGGDRMHRIATFRDLSRAKEYATALHRKTGRRVSVTH